MSKWDRRIGLFAQGFGATLALVSYGTLAVMFACGQVQERAEPASCSMFAAHVAMVCDYANDDGHCGARYDESYKACINDVERGEAVCWNPAGGDGPFCVLPGERHDQHP